VDASQCDPRFSADRPPDPCSGDRTFPQARGGCGVGTCGLPELPRPNPGRWLRPSGLGSLLQAMTSTLPSPGLATAAATPGVGLQAMAASPPAANLPLASIATHPLAGPWARIAGLPRGVGLPARGWSHLGPAGGSPPGQAASPVTRLRLSWPRTLASNCKASLDGFSSFLLIARRSGCRVSSTTDANRSGLSRLAASWPWSPLLSAGSAGRGAPRTPGAAMLRNPWEGRRAPGAEPGWSPAGLNLAPACWPEPAAASTDHGALAAGLPL